MGIYIICIILPLLFAVIENSNKQLGKYLFSFCCLFLFCVSAFRGYSVGTDTENYNIQYNFLGTSVMRSSFEISWYGLMWICKNVFNSYRAVLIVTSFLTIYYIRKSISRISNNWNLSLYYFVAFYFYFQSFNIMRQLLACAIVLYAFTFIKQKRITPFIIYVFFASTFHVSALVALPFYYISKIKLSRTISTILIALSFILSSILIPKIVDLVSGIELYSMYADGDVKETSYISMNLLLHSCIAFILLFDNNRDGIFYIFIMGLLFVNVTSLFDVLGRLGIYLKMAIILIIPNMRIRIAKMNLTTLSHVGFALLMLISCVVMLKDNSEGVYPYVFF